MSVVSALKREVPMAVFIACVVTIVLDYFVSFDILSTGAKYIQQWGSVVITFTSLLAFSLAVIIHGKTIKKKVAGEWYWSLYFMVLLLITIAVGLGYGLTSIYNTWIFEQFATSVYRAMVGSSALFIASGAYRTFRLRTIEGSVLVLVILSVLLGSTAFISVPFPIFKVWSDWLTTVPAVAVQRTGYLITYLGIIGLLIRACLGYEKGFFGEGT